MRHLRISKGDNDNLSSFKKQIDSILKKINKLDEAEKSEALNYVRQYINADNSSLACKVGTGDSAVDLNKSIETKTTAVKVKVPPKKRRKSVIRKTRIRAEKIKKPWLKCKVCDETKKTKISLLKHMELHIGTPITCVKCRRTFNSKITYDWHLIHLCRKRKRRVVVKRFKCSECPKEFTLERHLNLHIEGHRRNNCSYCDTVLTRREHLVQHMLNEHRIKLEKADFKCDHCDKWYVKRRSLYYHLRQHAPPHLVCLECGNISNTTEEHNEHIKKHEEQKPWQCPKCKDRFSRRQQYFYHLKSHDRYKCLTCNEGYSSKARAHRHKQRGHTVQGLEPKLHCPHCPAAFHRTLLLQIHIRKHKDETKIHCKFCDKTFHTPYQYYKHCMTTLHDKNSPEINQLVCENCGKQFTKKYVLEQHLHRFHGSKSGTFSCKYCPYKTRCRPNLTRHMNLHFTTDKEFVCDHCGKSFSTFATLTDHINYIHVQEKQFKCTDCDKSFKRKSELVRHQSCHSDARPHGCQICGQSYKRTSHLRRHEETAHALVNKSSRVQRLKTDETGAVIPVPLERKKTVKQQNKINSSQKKDMVYTLTNETSKDYVGLSVPVITSVSMPKHIAEENLMGLETNEFNQQEFWSDKLNLVDKNDVVVYNTDPTSLNQMPSFSAQGGDLQTFNIVDQFVNSLLPSKDLQIVDCQVYNEYPNAPLEYNNLNIVELNKRDEILKNDQIGLNNVTW